MRKDGIELLLQGLRYPYPPFRDMPWQRADINNTPGPGFSSLEADRKSWHRSGNGRGFKICCSDRRFCSDGLQTASDLADLGSPKVKKMSRQYPLMRSSSAPRLQEPAGESLGLFMSTPSNLGPGSYGGHPVWAQRPATSAQLGTQMPSGTPSNLGAGSYGAHRQRATSVRPGQEEAAAAAAGDPFGFLTSVPAMPGRGISSGGRNERPRSAPAAGRRPPPSDRTLSSGSQPTERPVRPQSAGSRPPRCAGWNPRPRSASQTAKPCKTTPEDQSNLPPTCEGFKLKL